MTDSALKIFQDKASGNPAIETKGFHARIHDSLILNDINIHVPEQQITCIIGPSGSGKSTLIRSINRINDETPGYAMQGEVKYQGISVYDPTIDPVQLRSNIGMVFQKPCVFPRSIAENVLFGIGQQRKIKKLEKLQLVEKHLKAVSLWKEVSHRLNNKATELSQGQQQRLCIARTLAVGPKAIMLDEPTSSLDPSATRAIEEMMVSLKKDYTLLFVTHDIQQARRIADHVIFLCDGKVIEQGTASRIFNNPLDPQTKAYLGEGFCDC